MTSNKPSILIVEDDDAAVFGYTSFLTDSGFEVQAVSTLKDATDIVASTFFDAILLDLKLPDGNALSWLPPQKQANPDTPIIVITGTSDIPTAVQATKNGADNFLTKPVGMEDLHNALTRVLELKLLRKKNLLQQRLTKEENVYFGSSSPISEIKNLAQIAAANNAVVLLLGETGTGKGVLAKWIHENSTRNTQPFVELNCSSLKGELLRSELFGHVKGSFTSAIKDREGLIELADGGTLFLDEIGDMDLEVQAQLLKTLEEKTFRRIGENKTRQSNFRLICATNRDLLQESKEKRFRSDLYYRICVFPITVPSLCDRKEDIPGLIEHFLTKLGYTHVPVAEEIIEMLTNYRWPGNVRELRNMLERASLISQGQPFQPHHFPGITTTTTPDTIYDGIENLSEIEQRHILHIVSKYNGDKKLASQALGMSFSNLYRKLTQINQSNKIN